MIWKGQQLDTIGQYLDAICAIYKKKDPQEAIEFTNLYLNENKYALENIGYLSGYCDKETMVGILQLFGARHPVFGGPVAASDMTPERAFELGKELGKKIREER
jgi:hypothetical protein